MLQISLKFWGFHELLDHSGIFVLITKNVTGNYPSTQRTHSIHIYIYS